jgi:hypothetical protein
MLQIVLWPILLIWMGLAVLITLSIVGMLLWGTAHQLKDEAGEDGEIYCPVLQRTMKVHGLPRRFTTGPEYADLSRCERWGDGDVQCTKPCLAAEAELAKGRTRAA